MTHLCTLRNSEPRPCHIWTEYALLRILWVFSAGTHDSITLPAVQVCFVLDAIVTLCLVSMKLALKLTTRTSNACLLSICLVFLPLTLVFWVFWVRPWPNNLDLDACTQWQHFSTSWLQISIFRCDRDTWKPLTFLPTYLVLVFISIQVLVFSKPFNSSLFRFLDTNWLLYLPCLGDSRTWVSTTSSLTAQLFSVLCSLLPLLP